MARRDRSKKHRRKKAGKHLRARTTGFRIVNRVAFVMLVGVACVAVAALSVPQLRELSRLKAELVRAEAQERHVLDRKEAKERELDALRSDPSYLELIARDRLDLHRTGETVFRIKRR